MHMKETRKPVRKPRTADEKKFATEPAPAKGKTAVRKKGVKVRPPTMQASPDDDREERVRMAAYFRAERRGFVRGYEQEDWFAAEAEVGDVAPSPQGARPPTEQRRRARPRDQKA